MNNINRILVSIAVIFSLNCNAQMTINYDSLPGPIVNGLEVIIDTTTNSNIALPHFYVTNNTGSTQNWMITRKVISQPADWLNYLCWGDLCYSVSPLTVWSSITATIDDGDNDELSVYIGAPSDGSAHYRYYVSSDGINYLDSVDVILNATTFVTIEESSEIEMSLYPNPAKNSVSIAGFSNDVYDLSVYDFTGRLVYSIENLNDHLIDVTAVKNGNYIFILKNRQTQQFTRQQVVIEK